jgi:hypothetical protein
MQQLAANFHRFQAKLKSGRTIFYTDLNQADWQALFFQLPKPLLAEFSIGSLWRPM